MITKFWSPTLGRVPNIKFWDFGQTSVKIGENHQKVFSHDFDEIWYGNSILEPSTWSNNLTILDWFWSFWPVIFYTVLDTFTCKNHEKWKKLPNYHVFYDFNEISNEKSMFGRTTGSQHLTILHHFWPFWPVLISILLLDRLRQNYLKIDKNYQKTKFSHDLDKIEMGYQCLIHAHHHIIWLHLTDFDYDHFRPFSIIK